MMKKISWAGGFFIGANWSTLNFLFTLNILKVALLKKDRTKMSLMLLVKFPILYLLGFIILVSGIFPISSLLLGVGLIFVVIGVNKLYLRSS
jgi:ABC-type multidrug transport system permease subunit